MNDDEVQRRLDELGVDEEDFIEKFILGSGPGGQKINKTASCVYLRHEPTGVEVKCQKGRSRDENRQLARLMLCDKIEEMERKRRQAKKQVALKKMRRERKKSRAQKQKMIHDKRHHSEKKSGRRQPKDNSD